MPISSKMYAWWFCKKHNHQFRIHIKVDTGMTRLGVLENEIELINMGILKKFRGKKLGSILLKHAIKTSFKQKRT